MTALTQDKALLSREGTRFSYPIAASAVVYAGAMIVLNSSGYAAPATRSSSNSAVVGVAERAVNNSSGANGALNVAVETGVFRLDAFTNETFTRRQIGSTVYANDDAAVSRSSTGSRPKAGVIVDVDDHGVWVRVGA